MATESEAKPRAVTFTARWMMMADRSDVLEIERECFGDDAWSAQTIVGVLRSQNGVAMVAETFDCEVAGYCVYRLYGDTIQLARIAVHPKYRRTGAARALVESLKRRTMVAHSPKRSVMCLVRDDNLAMHLLLRNCGFRSVGIVVGFWTDADAYTFEFNGRAG